MSISTNTITPAQREKILSFNENHFLDLKSKDIKPNKLSKTLSGFANAEGGELYVGIEDCPRIWNGFNNPEDANGFIQLFESLFPMGQFASYSFLECEGSQGLILHVDIKKTSTITAASDGTAYLRRSAQNLPQTTHEQIIRLELDKGITSYETHPVAVNDISLVTDSYAITHFLIEVIPTTEAEPWLSKQQLIQSGKPTVAAIILFADEPQGALPKKCGIKIYRYQTSDAQGTRETLEFQPISIEGCLYNQTYAAVEGTIKIIEDVSVLIAGKLSKAKYPVEALHEIITNAVLHRDYSIADDIHIRIFDNRIEIESPGQLPGHITPENILNERFARNGSVVRIINKFPNPPNKDVGEGLNTAFEAMRNLRLKSPVIEQKENSVLVTIRHESLASPEDTIIEYLQSNDYITNIQVRKLCHIGSENKVKNIFKKMIKLDMIERIPELKGNKSAYRLK